MGRKGKVIKSIRCDTSGWVYEQGENGKWRCPCCERFVLKYPDMYDYCPVCGMINSEVMLEGGLRIGQKMTFEEAKRAWEKGKKVE